MATNVTIANLALAHLGDDATVASIDPPEGSIQAEHCALWLPIARDAMLENFAWHFAKRRIQPPLRAESFSAWQFCYALPASCLRVRGVLPEGYINDGEATADFELESTEDGASIILTNTENATILYTARVTDPARFSPLFVDALAWLLASYIAGPIYKGPEGMQMATQAYGVFRNLWAQATVSSANQRKGDPTDRIPPHLKARA